MTPSRLGGRGFTLGGLDCYPLFGGLLKTLVKLGLINLTHKTPLRGTIPPLEGARLDHTVTNPSTITPSRSIPFLMAFMEPDTANATIPM
jgi:hypothetical protein